MNEGHDDPPDASARHAAADVLTRLLYKISSNRHGTRPTRIIARKGATYYAIGLGLLAIVEAILRNQHTVLTVSSLMAGEYGVPEICISLPTIVGARPASKPCSNCRSVLRKQRRFVTRQQRCAHASSR